VSESAVSAKVVLGLIWHEIGAVWNARPSRGWAASTWKRHSGTKVRSLTFWTFGLWRQRRYFEHNCPGVRS